MIHHISISVKNPQHVAQVLAEIWHGHALPFPPVRGAYIVMAGDEHGTAIEISPLGTELLPGEADEQVHSFFNQYASNFTATHAALSVPTGEERIKEIAEREGWRAITLDRGNGAFSLVEFWVENRLLLELLPPDMANRYLEIMTPQNYAGFFGFELAA